MRPPPPSPFPTSLTPPTSSFPPPPGKGAPKSLPNVEVQNAEPRMEDDGSSMAESGEDVISVCSFKSAPCNLDPPFISLRVLCSLAQNCLMTTS